LALLAAAMLVALLARATLPDLLDPVSGLFLVAALVVGVSSLRFWARVRLPPMPGLFLRPSPDGRWCAVCGRPAPAGTCPRCRTRARRKRRETL